MTKKPLNHHDVRQSAYRGNDAPAESSGIPDGRDRKDPSAAPGDAEGNRQDTAADTDRSGRTQPNLGQAGTYGAHGEHAGDAHGHAATPDTYHRDDAPQQEDAGKDKQHRGDHA